MHLVSLTMNRNKVGGTIAALLLLAAPLQASALSFSDLTAQLTEALSRITALRESMTAAANVPVSEEEEGGGTEHEKTCPEITTNLKRGSRDSTTNGSVSELQIFLADYYSIDEETIVTGYFGRITERYVKQFQTEHDLPAFGIVGSLTRAKIAEVCGGGTTRLPGQPDPLPRTDPKPLPPAEGETVTPEQFGAVGDCVADDTAALVAMRNHLRAHQDSVGGAPLLTANFGNNKCYKYTDNRWTWGLKNLRLIGNGSSFQNTASHLTHEAYGAYALVTNRGFFEATQMTGPNTTGQFGKKIRTAAAWDTRVVLTNPQEASEFTPGTWALVHSYDQQILNSWPPNARYFDYVKIVSTNGTTGEITFESPLEYRHDANYPEVTGEYGGDRIGGARILRLDYSDVPFAEKLYMENMTFLDNPGAVRPDDRSEFDRKAHNYLLVAGVLEAKLHNINAASFVPTMARYVEAKNSRFYLAEADKLVRTLFLENVTVDTELGAATGVNTLRVSGGSIGGPALERSQYNSAPVAVAPRYALFNNVTFSRAHDPNKRPTVDLNQSFPTLQYRIENSHFIGGGGQSIPVGQWPSLSFLLNGSGTTVESGGKTILLSNAGGWGVTTPERDFLRCIVPGGLVGVKYGGAGLEYAATIINIENVKTNRVRIDVGADTTLSSADTLVCHAQHPGSVELINNTYQNYGGPAELPRAYASSAPGSTQPNITLPKSTVAPNEAFTVSFTGVNSVNTWVGVYETGAPQSQPLQWSYMNGQRTLPTTDALRATGSVSLAGIGAPRSYEVRLITGQTVHVTLMLTVQSATTQNPTLTLANASVAAGEPITGSFAGVADHNTWAGLFKPGDPQSAPIDWYHVSGTKQLGTGEVPRTGSFSYATTNLSPGTYEIRLILAQTTYDKKTFTVTGNTVQPSLSLPQTTFAVGQSIPVSFSGVAGNNEWIGLFEVGAPQSQPLDWFYTTGDKTGASPSPKSGTITFAMTLAPREYELRLIWGQTVYETKKIRVN